MTRSGRQQAKRPGERPAKPSEQSPKAIVQFSFRDGERMELDAVEVMYGTLQQYARMAASDDHEFQECGARALRRYAEQLIAAGIAPIVYGRKASAHAKQVEANNLDAVLIAWLHLGRVRNRGTVGVIRRLFRSATPPVVMSPDTIRKHLDSLTTMKNE